MSQIKILVDGRTIKNNPSGLGVWNLQLVRFLLKKASFQIFLLISKNCSYNFNLDPDLAPHLNDKLKLISVNHDYRFVDSKRFFFEQFTLPKLISQYQIQIYHATDSFGIPFLVNKKVKIVLTVHDLIPLTAYREYLNLGKLILYFISLKIAVKKANQIIAISEKTKEDIVRYLGVREKKVAVIYDGVDNPNTTDQSLLEQAFIKLNKQYGLKKQQYVLYYGGFGPRRNVPLLIRCFAKFINEKHDQELKLVLSGRIQGAKAQALTNLQSIQELVRKLNIQKRVIFLDYLTPIQKNVLSKFCLLFAAFSQYEGFGLGPLEVVKFNRPVLSTKAGILASFPKPNYYLLDSPQEFQIVNKIREIALGINPVADLRKLQMFVSRFSWKKMADQYQQFYLTLDANKNNH